MSCGDCEKDYIGETERAFKSRFDEHRKSSSVNSEVSCYIHQENPGHSVRFDGIQDIGGGTRMVSTRGEGINFCSCDEAKSQSRWGGGGGGAIQSVPHLAQHSG